jgi:pseudouridine synthase
MPEETSLSYPVRLNRYLAACGVAARRKAEALIAEGRVAVDGIVETSVGRVLSAPADVRVDGIPVGPARPVYIVMHKPRGVLSAVQDARERTVVDLLPAFYSSLGVFPVGRLDKESEGLILLTNDGKFAQELLHPSFGVRRTYAVVLRWKLGEDTLARWREGVIIEQKHAKPLSVRPTDDSQRHFEVVLGEGFKREIRLMAQALGNRVVRLRRTAIGNLTLKKLPLGTFCEYNLEDIMQMIRCGGEV